MGSIVRPKRKYVIKNPERYGTIHRRSYKKNKAKEPPHKFNRILMPGKVASERQPPTFL